MGVCTWECVHGSVYMGMCLCISRNGPYIGGHLAFFFSTQFKMYYKDYYICT